MRGDADETVGQNFNRDLLQSARDRTLAVIEKSASLVKAGMSEDEARLLVKKVQTEMGAPKSWHPPQIRFGPNTLLPFGQKGVENPILRANDIYFFDIGPIFDEHEGDVGRPFVVGNDPDMKRLVQDTEIIWHEVRTHWFENTVTGKTLYQFATQAAEKRGWILALDQANGHRIADFPHAARMRGSIEGWGKPLTSNRWILEIQTRHPVHPYGAFYEDLLN